MPGLAWSILHQMLVLPCSREGAPLRRWRRKVLRLSGRVRHVAAAWQRHSSGGSHCGLRHTGGGVSRVGIAKSFIEFPFLSPSPRLESLWVFDHIPDEIDASVAAARDGAFARGYKPAGHRRLVQIDKKEANTMDIVVLGIGILLFALSFAYIKACDIL